MSCRLRSSCMASGAPADSRCTWALSSSPKVAIEVAPGYCIPAVFQIWSGRCRMEMPATSSGDESQNTTISGPPGVSVPCSHSVRTVLGSSGHISAPFS